MYLVKQNFHVIMPINKFAKYIDEFPYLLFCHIMNEKFLQLNFHEQDFLSLDIVNTTQPYNILLFNMCILLRSSLQAISNRKRSHFLNVWKISKHVVLKSTLSTLLSEWVPWIYKEIDSAHAQIKNSQLQTLNQKHSFNIKHCIWT